LRAAVYGFNAEKHGLTAKVEHPKLQKQPRTNAALPKKARERQRSVAGGEDDEDDEDDEAGGEEDDEAGGTDSEPEGEPRQKVGRGQPPDPEASAAGSDEKDADSDSGDDESDGDDAALSEYSDGDDNDNGDGNGSGNSFIVDDSAGEEDDEGDYDARAEAARRNKAARRTRAAKRAVDDVGPPHHDPQAGPQAIVTKPVVRYIVYEGVTSLFQPLTKKTTRTGDQRMVKLAQDRYKSYVLLNIAIANQAVNNDSAHHAPKTRQSRKPRNNSNLSPLALTLLRHFKTNKEEAFGLDELCVIVDPAVTMETTNAAKQAALQALIELIGLVESQDGTEQTMYQFAEQAKGNIHTCYSVDRSVLRMYTSAT
jgi:hypothetical protein